MTDAPLIAALLSNPFPSLFVFIACTVIMAGAQFVYATVGFGAGMFAVSLLAFVLPELGPTVAVLMVLTFVTEVTVIFRAGRHANLRLAIWLIVPGIIGMWVGTRILVAGDVGVLKRLLGFVVGGAGIWFLQSERRRPAEVAAPAPPDALRNTTDRTRSLIALPAGFASGLLGGLFGTAAPPLIVVLRGYRLDKSTFRATLITIFFVMSFTRAPMYWMNGILNAKVLIAALWLSPAAAIGTASGMIAHHRISERKFAILVAGMLIVMGALLLISGGRAS